MPDRDLTERDARALAAINRLCYQGAGLDPDDATIFEAVDALLETLGDQADRIAELEATVERLEATASGPELSKREKHEAVVNAAQNKRQSGQGGPQGVPLDYSEVMAATSVSRRYAYELMKEIAAAYPWASYDTTSEPYTLKISLSDRDWAGLVASVHENLSEG